jgi:hypothetical protein
MLMIYKKKHPPSQEQTILLSVIRAVLLSSLSEWHSNDRRAKDAADSALSVLFLS